MKTGWGSRLIVLASVLWIMAVVPAWGEAPGGDPQAFSPEQTAPERPKEAQESRDFVLMSERLGRGIANTLGGWLEIFIGMDQGYHASKDQASGMLAGGFRGLGRGVVRTAVGLYETVTFCVTDPEQSAPILPPLEYYRRHPTRRALPLE